MAKENNAQAFLDYLFGNDNDEDVSLQEVEIELLKYMIEDLASI